MNLGTSFQAFADSAFANAAAQTLIHFLWQGMLIGIFALLALKLLRNYSANLRYVVSSCLLASMALAPVATGMWLFSTTQITPAIKRNAPDVLARQHVTSEQAALASHTNPMVPTQRSELDREWDVTPNPIALIASAPALSSRPTPHWSLRLRYFVVLGWLTGVALLSVRLSVSWLRVHSIRSSGKVVSKALCDTLIRLCKSVGIHSKILLFESRTVDSPIQIGWLRPVIMLPISFTTGLNQNQIESILLHELAHIHRQDYLVNMLQSMVETILFYHPAVWWLSAQVRLEREHCCDDWAIKHSGDPVGYARSLLAMEELRTSTSLAMNANGGNLLTRIDRIVRPTNQKKPTGAIIMTALFGSAIVLGILTLVAQPNKAMAVPLAPQQAANLADDQQDPAAEQDRHPDDLPKQVTFQLLDEQGQPVASQPLSAYQRFAVGGTEPSVTLIRNGDRWMTRNEQGLQSDSQADRLVTDRNGRATINLNLGAASLLVSIRPDGFVPMQCKWDIKMGKTPLSQVKVHLTKGTQIGGFVFDEDGQPVVNAKVLVKCLAPDQTGSIQTSQNLVDTPVLTNNNGYWQCNNAPPNRGVEIVLTIEHKDFLVSRQLPKPETTAAAYAKQLKTTMHEGVSPRGEIKDQEGRPILDALVVLGTISDGLPRRRDRLAKTDANGQYQFPPSKEPASQVTVMAKGFQPATKPIPTSAPDVDFQLQPGKNVRIKVVDHEMGTVIANAGVVIDGWEGILYNFGATEEKFYSGIPNSTNEEGVFDWTWAPESEVTYVVYSPGYASRRVKLTAGDLVHEVRLTRPKRITARVIDSVTKKPIENFRFHLYLPEDITPNIETDLGKLFFGSNAGPWSGRISGPRQNGEFHFDLEECNGVVFEFSSVGYRRKRHSKTIELGANDSPFVVEMEKINQDQ